MLPSALRTGGPSSPSPGWSRRGRAGSAAAHQHRRARRRGVHAPQLPDRVDPQELRRPLPTHPGALPCLRRHRTLEESLGHARRSLEIGEPQRHHFAATGGIRLFEQPHRDQARVHVHRLRIGHATVQDNVRAARRRQHQAEQCRAAVGREALQAQPPFAAGALHASAAREQSARGGKRPRHVACIPPAQRLGTRRPAGDPFQRAVLAPPEVVLPRVTRDRPQQQRSLGIAPEGAEEGVRSLWEEDERPRRRRVQRHLVDSEAVVAENALRHRVPARIGDTRRVACHRPARQIHLQGLLPGAVAGGEMQHGAVGAPLQRRDRAIRAPCRRHE